MSAIRVSLFNGEAIVGSPHDVQAEERTAERQQFQRHQAQVPMMNRGGAHRASISGDQTEAEALPHMRPGAPQPQRQQTDIFDGARTMQGGFPVSRDAITDETVLRTPGGQQWPVRSLLLSGEVRKLADGSYEHVATGARSRPSGF